MMDEGCDLAVHRSGNTERTYQPRSAARFREGMWIWTGILPSKLAEAHERAHGSGNRRTALAGPADPFSGGPVGPSRLQLRESVPRSPCTCADMQWHACSCSPSGPASLYPGSWSCILLSGVFFSLFHLSYLYRNYFPKKQMWSWPCLLYSLCFIVACGIFTNFPLPKLLPAACLSASVMHVACVVAAGNNVPSKNQKRSAGWCDSSSARPSAFPVGWVAWLRKCWGSRKTQGPQTPLSLKIPG